MGASFFVGVGITDNIILAGGTPLLWTGEDRLFWFAPKVKILDTGKTQAAVGVLSFFATGTSGSAGLLYGSVTRGSPKASFTGGIGWAYWEDEIGNTPTILLGGEMRVSRRLKLITENYVFLDAGVILSAGPRFFGERLSADVGLAFPIFGEDEFFFFPLINFVWNF